MEKKKIKKSKLIIRIGLIQLLLYGLAMLSVFVMTYAESRDSDKKFNEAQENGCVSYRSGILDDITEYEYEGKTYKAIQMHTEGWFGGGSEYLLLVNPDIKIYGNPNEGDGVEVYYRDFEYVDLYDPDSYDDFYYNGEYYYELELMEAYSIDKTNEENLSMILLIMILLSVVPIGLFIILLIVFFILRHLEKKKELAPATTEQPLENNYQNYE